MLRNLAICIRPSCKWPLKPFSLRRATLLMDAAIHFSWPGLPACGLQALNVPSGLSADSWRMPPVPDVPFCEWRGQAANPDHEGTGSDRQQQKKANFRPKSCFASRCCFPVLPPRALLPRIASDKWGDFRPKSRLASRCCFPALLPKAFLPRIASTE